MAKKVKKIDDIESLTDQTGGIDLDQDHKF